MTAHHTITYTTPPCEEQQKFRRLIQWLKYPQYIEGWEPVTVDDPNEVEPGEPVSEWRDARNSRPEPY